MQGDIRRKVEMSTRVRIFSRAHPSTDPSYPTMVGRLEELLARADLLGGQERSGRLVERAATARRKTLRHAMQRQLLRHLARVGKLVAKQRPDLLDRFQLPSPHASYKSFLIAAKVILAEAQANRDLFVSLGLSAAMLDELAKAVAEFEAVTESGIAGRNAHIGARADLSATADELVDQVEVLNTFNQFRYKDDPELLAAWESSRNVVGPFRPRVVVPPAQGETTPPATGVSPAA